MDKIINSALELIEATVIFGMIGYGGAIGLKTLHDQVRKETIEALKKPTPSLSRFTRQLTAPSR